MYTRRLIEKQANAPSLLLSSLTRRMTRKSLKKLMETPPPPNLLKKMSTKLPMTMIKSKAFQGSPK